MDILIKGGTVVDGTGAPAFEADVGIADGKIVEVGNIKASATEEIDARGQIVTPGFVDIHTHYDGQAVWDSHLAPSSWHGVTTAIMGNCSVGFAPCKPEDRDRLIELMEGVEDIPAPAMHEGLDWKWHSFADFLDRLDKKPHDIDIAALLPHAPVRVYVMGKRATFQENATDEDIAQMKDIARDAMKAGAFGFSTSRNMSHRTLKGEFIPTLRAQEKELTGIAMGVREAGAGMFEFVSDWDQPDAKSEFNMARRVVEKSGVSFLFSMAQRHSKRETFDELIKMADQAAQDGLCMRPVIAPRPIGVLLGLQGSQNPFSGCPTYRKLSHLSVPERAKAMRDPAVRTQILSEDPRKESTFPLMERLGYDRMFHFADPINYEPSASESLTAIAQKRGTTAAELAYDLITENDGLNFLFAPIANYADLNLDFVGDALKHRNALVGLGDGGAHVGFISDGSFPTFLLSYWGRDRGKGLFDLPELVRRQTSDTADVVGLHDRGRIAVGKKADINVINYDALKLHRPYIVHDMPAGGKRLLQKADGYTATIKSGALTFRDGEATGKLPGVLLRGGPAVAPGASLRASA